MTNKRQIYYRRKDKSVVIEGKQDGKSVLIWTLPNDPISLLEFLIKASYFEQEKAEKISEKVKRLDFKPGKQEKDTHEVRLPIINRNPENDADEEEKHEVTEEENKKLWEMTE